MAEPLTFDLGLVKAAALPVTAFAGPHGRVHATERAAIIDLATQELAKLWLKTAEVGTPSFATLMEMIETNPEVAEAAVKLAFFKMNS